MVSSSFCWRVVCFDFRVSERKMARFLDEALNEPVDDSVSEDVSETEYSPWQEYYNIHIIVFKYI